MECITRVAAFVTLLLCDANVPLGHRLAVPFKSGSTMGPVTDKQCMAELR